MKKDLKTKISKNNKEIFEILKKEFLDKKTSLNGKQKIDFVANKLCVNSGTIKRWILLKEIPWQYFADINTICCNKYELIQTERERNKQLDQFYTNKLEAKKLITDTINFIKNNYDININEYTFIEPSAGNGAFYDNIPSNFKKIGIDIEPKNSKIIKWDFFNFTPSSKKNIIIGNPPFGLRGNLALRFINTAFEFSDFICFILPPLFSSNGKGSPMTRVNKNLMLVKEIKIDNKSFNYPDGEEVLVNSIFQIWTKIQSPKIKPISPPSKISEWVKIYSLSDGINSSSKRNVKMINKCDYYLPSTTFNKISIERKFENLPHSRGYGIVILKDNEKIKRIIEEINWQKVSFASTNNAKNLRSNLIIKAIEELI